MQPPYFLRRGCIGRLGIGGRGGDYEEEGYKNLSD